MISHLKEHTSKVTKVKLIGDNEAAVLSSSKDRARTLFLDYHYQIINHFCRSSLLGFKDGKAHQCAYLAHGRN
jgi:hypothetical protein